MAILKSQQGRIGKTCNVGPSGYSGIEKGKKRRTDFIPEKKLNNSI